MDGITEYPIFSPLSLGMVQSLKDRLSQLSDGISEFTLGNLYYFKDFYQYQVCAFEDTFIFLGKYKEETFFFIPFGTVPARVIMDLLAQYGPWRFISEASIQNNAELFEQLHCLPLEDRDNFDYLYARIALSSLTGKKFHKKKNHVQAFLRQYPDTVVKQLDGTTKEDAYRVLEVWAKDQPLPEQTDYRAACSALDGLEESCLFGSIVYAAGMPVAWCLAEMVCGGRMAVVHFEKARTDFRGSYQYINYAFAQSLPESVEYINREQDLGDSGLRKAKMSYHPEQFIKKYWLPKGAVVEPCN